MALGAGARVHRGFDDAIRVAMTTVQEAGQLVVLLPQHNFEEFGPVLLGEFRAVVARGGSVRILVVGDAPAELTRAVAEVGAEVRALREAREVGIVATDTTLLLFPPEQRPDSPLTVCLLEVEDPVALAHFRLAFERAWERALPAAAPRSRGAAGRGRAQSA